MRLVLQAEDKILDLEFDRPAEAERFFTDAREQDGFFLQLEHKLELFQRLSLRARAPGLELECAAEVVQRFSGAGTFGTAFQLRDFDPAAFARALAGETTSVETDAVETDEQQAKVSPSELSPVFRIKKLNVTQRFQLAMKASRIERQILIRDTSPQVLLGLLSHPQIEDKEVLDLVKSNYASSGIMQRVADHRKWMSNPEIRLAVVRSPKTPPQVALKHLDSLRTRELGTMAKGAWVRESLRKAALKLYLRRIGRPP